MLNDARVTPLVNEADLHYHAIRGFVLTYKREEPEVDAFDYCILSE